MSNTKIEDMASEVARIFTEYAKATDETVQKAVNQTSKDTAALLQQNSPKDRGEYAANWKYGPDTRKRSKNAKVVYNKKYYRLTHLLENGHAKRGGGHTKAQPHIGPAADKAEQELLKLIKEGISKQ